MPTTIVFLETELRLGGTERVVMQLIERMDRSRFRPVLCCVYGLGELGEKLKQKNVEVVHGLAKNRWDPWVPLRLFNFLRRERAGVLFIVNQPLLQFWGTWCGVLAGVPVRIMAVRNAGRMTRFRRRRWVHKLTSPCLTRITALSESHRVTVSRDYEVPDSKIAVVPNGVDLARFDKERLQEPQGLEIPEGAPVAGIVAMLRTEKNHALFLRAAQRVLREVPDAVFLVVGDGEERQNLERLADELGIRGSVRFTGARNDIPSIMNKLDVGVLVSNREGLPNAVLEYMACGKPVVATSVGCVPDLIEEGVTGYMLPPGDLERLADRLTFLLKNRDIAGHMGQTCRKIIVEGYTLEKMVSRTEDLFEQLLPDERKPFRSPPTNTFSHAA